MKIYRFCKKVKDRKITINTSTMIRKKNCYNILGKTKKKYEKKVEVMNSKMKSFCLSPPEQQQQHQLEVIDKRVNKIFKKPFGIQIRYRKKLLNI